MTVRLHDHDPYQWAQEQAALLKAGRFDQLDATLLAEEIEDLGNEIRNACLTLTRRILEHLLKLGWSPQHPPRPHWRGEVAAFRADLEQRLTRSIERQIDLEQLYAKAVRVAITALDEPGFAARLPIRCPWTLAQLQDDDFWPSPQADAPEDV